MWLRWYIYYLHSNPNMFLSFKILNILIHVVNILQHTHKIPLNHLVHHMKRNLILLSEKRIWAKVVSPGGSSLSLLLHLKNTNHHPTVDKCDTIYKKYSRCMTWHSGMPCKGSFFVKKSIWDDYKTWYSLEMLVNELTL